MKRLLLIIAAAAGLAAPRLPAAALPPLEELSALIRSNLADVSEEEIRRAAVEGVLDHFKGRVVLGELKPAAGGGALVSRAARYEEHFALVRLSRVEAGAAGRVKAALGRLGQEGPLRGLVLDVRYAGGSDYRAAAQVADLFVAGAQPLLDWGLGRAAARAKSNALTLPLVVLVNGQTRGAAEALAAVLRQAAGALVVGATTAGETGLFQRFTLSDGQVVHVAGGRLRVGGQPLPTGGVRPDFPIEVGPRDERAWFADPFKQPPVQVASAVTPPAEPRRRINEAELVRRQREGIAADDPVEPAAVPAVPARPVVRDPALARGLDLLKALAILQPRPPAAASPAAAP